MAISASPQQPKIHQKRYFPSFHIISCISCTPPPPPPPLKSTDPVGLLSTMHFVVEQCSKYNDTTFDQPLYWKSMSIKENQDDNSPIRKSVIRLGGFHQVMSFLVLLVL